ncbi:MAG: efflux RND transporter periplasmic adaptor subunit [Peptococcaceae bacterium]|nr:efflux RND transporter periplasmic adaptor subunit [Peptococcaceae bacterium]MDH7525100.1 efflux RND transporter periplasmic adaptor subunit [Peptococcaceae bacterium]
MDKKRRAAAAAAVLMLLLTGSYLVYKGFFSRTGDVIQATGTIEATTIELNARSAGAVERIAVKAGDYVKQGQLVAELSRKDLVAQRERDELAVVKAEASLNDLLSGARVQEKNEAAANVKIARADYQKASDDLARMEALYEEGAVPAVEVEQARTACEISKSKLEAAEARLSLLEEGSRPEQIEAARAEVERCRAVLKASEALLEDLKLYSPVDGVVLSKNYEEGEFVQLGASIATVADLNDLWIRVYIPTDDLPRVKLGQKVSFSVSGFNKSFEGLVEEIASRGEFTPKTIQTKKERTNVVFAVKIRIDSAGGVLKPGMPADVSFDREQ